MSTRSVKVPFQQTRADVRPTSANAEKRTIEVVWSVGARGLRYTWDGSYYEELSMDPSHLKLDRLKSGAQVLDNHDKYSGLRSIIGVVEDAWIENNREGVARIRLSEDEDKQGVVRDILSGIIKNLSVGYSVRKYVEVGRDNDTPIFRAEDWEPFELSFVPVPFDHSAQSRSAEGAQVSECIVVTTEENKTMEEVTSQKEAERSMKIEVDRKAAEDAEKRGREIERKRAADIVSATEKAGLDRSFADTLINGDVSIDLARERILDEISARGKLTATKGIAAGDQDEIKTQRKGLEEHLLTRMAPDKFQPTEFSQRFRSYTLLEMCKLSLRAAGMNPENFTKSEIAQRALHTTSDFGTVIGSSVKKTLSTYYQGAPADWSFLTTPKGLTDYKQLLHVGLSSGPQLLEVKEHGEYKRGTMAEQAEAMQLKKYGRILGITREMIVNDDLGALTDMPRHWAFAARNLEADLVLQQILGNPTMGDGVALFHVSHGNLAGSGTALDIASLSAAVAALESQTGVAGLDSSTNYLRLKARYLIVGSAQKTAAIQLTTSIDPVTFATVNPFGYLEVKSDPSITGNQWYVAADPRAGVDTIAELFLEGERGPQTFEREGFDVDGLEYKVRLDTGAKVLDWRWIYKNPGL